MCVCLAASHRNFAGCEIYSHSYRHHSLTRHTHTRTQCVGRNKSTFSRHFYNFAFISFQVGSSSGGNITLPASASIQCSQMQKKHINDIATVAAARRLLDAAAAERRTQTNQTELDLIANWVHLNISSFAENTSNIK